MKASITLLVLLLFAPAAVATPADAPPGGSDAEAIALAGRVMEALGGEERWNGLRGLRWTFASAVGDTVRPGRRHSWDKHTGWHRVSGIDREGLHYLVIHNLHTGEGRAWLAGRPVPADSLATLLTRGRNLWINDAYWLLMPYKLRDPGVTLRMAEPLERDGVTCARMSLRFTAVGNTPGDRYWVQVDPGTHRIVRWEMVLQNQEPPPREYSLEDWQDHDGLWFATSHRAGNVNILTHEIETVSEFPSAEFEAP